MREMTDDEVRRHHDEMAAVAVSPKQHRVCRAMSELLILRHLARTASKVAHGLPSEEAMYRFERAVDVWEAWKKEAADV